MNLNELKDEAYSIAKANGWHEQEYSDEHSLMLIITEVAEAVQADRYNRHADVAKFKEYQEYYKTFISSEEILTIRFKEDFEEYIKNSVEDELGDVIIRCLDLCGVKGLDAYTVNVEFPSGMDGFTDRMYFVCRQLTDRILTADSLTLGFVLSQTMSYIVEHCRRKDIDLYFFIRTKMNYNRLRGYHHGGKKY